MDTQQETNRKQDNTNFRQDNTNVRQENTNDNIDIRVAYLEEHYSRFNAEMGFVKANVEWLVWIIRWLIAGIGGTLFITLLNLVVALALKK